MRRFVVTVNGKRYDVGVEEVDQNTLTAAAVQTAQAPQSVPVQADEPETETEPKASSEIAEGTRIEAPMPGTIIEVIAKAGDTVSKGDPIIVLEAMKLENDILAPVMCLPL